MTREMTFALTAFYVRISDPNNRLWAYQRLPDARAEFPRGHLLSLPDRAMPRTIGVLTW